jgi:hypothetical protein
MRTAGSMNVKPKYHCEITILGNVVLDESYSSLRKLAHNVDLPYHTITDVFEGRRGSYQKYENRKYFPVIKITKICDEPKVSGAEKNDELIDEKSAKNVKKFDFGKEKISEEKENNTSIEIEKN